MMKFFRRIRHTLLLDGKTGKYLKYALGEIILVVIGILIALQINNWNEERKNRHKESELKTALLIDFQETKSRLQETIKRQKQALRLSKQLIVSYRNQHLMNIKDSLPLLTGFGFTSWWRVEPVTKTYQSMINTGSIDILKNSDLKQKLAEFHAELDNGFEDQEESMNLLDALNIRLAEYGFILKQNIFQDLSGSSIPDDLSVVSEEDVFKLQSDRSLFNLAAKRLLLEGNRLESQQKMANLVDEILMILNKHD